MLLKFMLLPKMSEICGGKVGKIRLKPFCLKMPDFCGKLYTLFPLDISCNVLWCIILYRFLIVKAFNKEMALVGFLRILLLTPSEVAPTHKLRTNLKYRELEEDDSWSEEPLPSWHIYECFVINVLLRANSEMDGGREFKKYLVQQKMGSKKWKIIWTL